MISGFVLSKYIAVFIGPQGIGLLGNLRNFINSIQTIASLGFYNAAVRYVAEFKKDNTELSKVLSTLFFFGIIGALSVSLIIWFFADYWSQLIFSTLKGF